MPVKLSSLKADIARETQGDWVEFPDWPGVAFNVSSLHLQSYVTARDLFMQRQKSKGGEPDKDEIIIGFGRLYAEHILHDWRGLDETYSPTLALTTLTDPAYREVVQAVEWCARKVAEIQVKFVDATGGNSAAPSAGA